MGAYIFPADAVSGNPSYTGRMLRQLLGVFAGGGVATRPLAGRSGVNPRTPSTTVAATSTTWTCHAHAGYIDGETSAVAGGYLYSFDTDQTGSMTAADGTNPRVDLISAQISDPAESDGSSNPGVAIVYTVGTPGASPSPPATPARSIALAQINVPASGGGAPSVTWVASNCAAAGGVMPVSGSSAYPASPFDGQMIFDKSSDTVYAYNGSSWRPYLPAIARQVARDSNLSVPDQTWTEPASYNLGTPYNVGSITYGSGILTVAEPGMYRWELVTSWPATTAVHSRQTRIQVNGSAVDHGRNAVFVDGSHGTVLHTAGGFVPLAAGDTVQASIWQSSGGTLAVVPELFTLVRVG